jgi:hypothetical protein
LPGGRIGDASGRQPFQEAVMAIDWPKHEASLHLTHNEHKSCYRTVQEEIDDGHPSYQQWVSPEQRQKAIDTNECWSIQWYPDTPIGSYALSAADLDVLIEAAREVS